MAKFKSVVITNSGRQLFLSAVQEKKAIEITHIMTGSGVYSAEDMESLTSLKEPREQFSVIRALREGNVLKVRADIDNKNTLAGYYIKEIGIYAKKGTDAAVLIGVTTATEADYLSDINTAPMKIFLEIFLSISNTKNLKFTYTVPTDVYVPRQELKEIAFTGLAKSLEQDSDNRFVTDDEKEMWNAKAEASEIERILKEKKVTISKEIWQARSDYFFVEKTIEDVRSTDNLSMYMILEGLNKAERKKYRRNYSLIYEGETRNNKILLKAEKKPDMDMTLGFRGV